MTMSNLLSYLQLLIKVKIIRVVYISGVYMSQLSGKAQISSIQPFETVYVKSAKSNRRIRVDIYRTEAALKANAGPVAVHLNWHGSGFILPVFGESRPFIEYLLKHENLASYPLAILDCDYAKAPEYPCPASTDDARDVLDYAFQHPQIYDIQRVTIGGFSAGACIALGISAGVGSEVRRYTWTHPLPDSSGHPIRAVIALYPPTTWGKDRPAPPIPEGTRFSGVVISKELVDIFEAAYFFPPSFDISPSSSVDIQRVQALQQEPLISPSKADPKDISETVVLITAEYDTLTQEGEELRQKLNTVPGKMIYGWSMPKAAHAWDLVVLPGDYGFDERGQAYDLAAKVIARVGGVQVDI